MTRGNLARRALCLAPLAVAGCMSGQRADTAGSATVAESAAMIAAVQTALEGNVSGTAEAWQDGASGSQGSVLPTRTFRTVSGLICRDYTVIVTDDGATAAEERTACRDSDGQWKDAG